MPEWIAAQGPREAIWRFAIRMLDRRQTRSTASAFQGGNA
jgi:hypothetical protein